MKKGKPFEWLSDDFTEFLWQAEQLSEEKSKLLSELLEEGNATDARWLRDENSIGYADEQNNAVLVVPALVAFAYTPEAKSIQWAYTNNSFKGCKVVPREVLKELYAQYDAPAFDQVTIEGAEERIAIRLCDCLETWMDAIGHQKLVYEAAGKALHIYFILMPPQE